MRTLGTPQRRQANKGKNRMDDAKVAKLVELLIDEFTHTRITLQIILDLQRAILAKGYQSVTEVDELVCVSETQMRDILGSDFSARWKALLEIESAEEPPPQV